MLLRHRKPEDWWTNNATIEDWFDEMVGQANIINRYAGISMEDMWGKSRNRWEVSEKVTKSHPGICQH